MQVHRKTDGAKRRLMRFGTVGFLNTAVDFGILNLLIFSLGVTSGPALVSCNAVAFVAASLNSYLCNKRWTFGEKNQASWAQYLLFFAFSLGGLAVNTAVIYLLTSLYPIGGALDPAMRINLAKVCATLASMTWNYTACRQVVFRKSFQQGEQTA